MKIQIPVPKRAFRAHLARTRIIAVFVTICALALGASSSASPALAATNIGTSCQASGYMQVDGMCKQIAHTQKLEPKASAALKKAFSTAAGRAALEKAFRMTGTKVGFVHTSPGARPAWTCPGGTSCGISSSGGWHFWFIASYAAVYNVGAFPFWVACTGALSPIIDPFAATAACGAVTAIIWALVNNAPYTTHHGIWMAVYWNHITDGYW